ncbi:MAG: MltA domain-containing protein [Alphaproteobacteria bacterium]|nr:MltA domain-containing protein [Alphaproteobacteria bacterium]
MRFLPALSLCLALLLPQVAAASGNTIHHSRGLSLTPMTFTKLSGWNTDAHGEALLAFQRSCTKLQAIPAAQIIGDGILAGNAGHWHRACIEANQVKPHDAVGARAFFEREFIPYQLAYEGDPRGKFTGYYEPLMQGSWQRSAEYNEPVYGRPSDLVNGQLYPLTRRDIDGGALTGKGLERMYISNPVDLFFLHVQGSGRVLMDSGETVALRYDGKTNQPYTAIGKVLIERGEISRENMSAPAIRKWLHDHPDQARELMHQNASYVFFQVEPESDSGPVGAQNVPLVPERSMAVDAAYIPLGTPLWLSTNLPTSLYGKSQTYQRLMVAQDKGSAILGAIRGDIFFGFGDRAEDLAGHMNGEGTLVALLPKKLGRIIEDKQF